MGMGNSSLALYPMWNTVVPSANSIFLMPTTPGPSPWPSNSLRPPTPTAAMPSAWPSGSRLRRPPTPTLSTVPAERLYEKSAPTPVITNPLDRAGAVVDGVFRKLLDKAAFQKAVYPGLSEEQRRGAPQSLQQLLESPLYSKVGG